jgi:hypothetical protein
VPITLTQRKLGHSAPQITMEFYYPDDEESVREISEQFSLAALEDVSAQRDQQPAKKVIRFEDYA